MYVCMYMRLEVEKCMYGRAYRGFLETPLHLLLVLRAQRAETLHPPTYIHIRIIHLIINSVNLTPMYVCMYVCMHAFTCYMKNVCMYVYI